MAVRWYAARTRPLAEYVARDNLETAGIEVFLPCAQVPKPRQGHQDMPLFPGYLFLHYDLEKLGWSWLSRVPQVAGLVSFEGEAPSLPDDVIDELTHRIEAVNKSGGVSTWFQPGERVRVTVGPTESLAKVVEDAKSPQSRVRVLLEFLGRLVEADVPWKNVQPLGAHRLRGNWNGQPPRRTRGKGRWIRGHGPRMVEGQLNPPEALNNGRSLS